MTDTPSEDAHDAALASPGCPSFARRFPRHPELDAIVEAFAGMRRAIRVFVAHDLDADNRRLLADGHVDVVLDHDLAQDMRRACQHIMHAHGALPSALVVPN